MRLTDHEDNYAQEAKEANTIHCGGQEKREMGRGSSFNDECPETQLEMRDD